MSNIEVLHGYDITNDYIDKLKIIAYSGYNDTIYNNYFKKIKDIKRLVGLHLGNSNDYYINLETLAITDTWFLCYTLEETYLKILEWVSINDISISDKYRMMKYIRDLLLICKNKYIYASLRHDTSYNIYSKLSDRGYFNTISDRLILDFSIPKELKTSINKYNSIEKIINDPNKYNEYYKYILHNIEFILDDSFFETYQKKL